MVRGEAVAYAEFLSGCALGELDVEEWKHRLDQSDWARQNPRRWSVVDAWVSLGMRLGTRSIRRVPGGLPNHRPRSRTRRRTRRDTTVGSGPSSARMFTVTETCWQITNSRVGLSNGVLGLTLDGGHLTGAFLTKYSAPPERARPSAVSISTLTRSESMRRTCRGGSTSPPTRRCDGKPCGTRQ